MNHAITQTIRKIWYNWRCAGLGEKLYGKQAAVQMDDYISTCLYITVGVPQGSVVNDKCTVSRKVKCILFAESTNAGKICRKYVAASSNVLMTDNINVEYMKNHFQV